MILDIKDLTEIKNIPNNPDREKYFPLKLDDFQMKNFFFNYLNGSKFNPAYALLNTSVSRCQTMANKNH